MPRDLEFLPGSPADPNFMPAALPVEIAIVLPKHLLHFVYFRSLPLPAASIIARIPTCVNPVDEEHKGVSEMVTPPCDSGCRFWTAGVHTHPYNPQAAEHSYDAPDGREN